MSGYTISDAHPHGALTVEQVIQKSSNVGVVKISMQMPASEIWETFSAIGLGRRPEIEFPGAESGRLRPAAKWGALGKATMSYGYGLSASLFQLAHAYTVFARDGELYPVSILKAPVPADGAAPVAPEGVRVFSAETAREVRHMLQMAAGPGGTGPKAQTIGYSVGGKSGTAHKQEGKGYAEKKYRAWFVGLAPVNNPRIVVAVMVDEPSAGKYYGGDVAAPVFSDLVQKTLQALNVPADLEVKAQIVAGPAEAVDESF
jgi:cell division protein FtsI (penicillin-binding protein 3)